MPRGEIVYTIFLSSPSKVIEEREIVVEVVSEINKIWLNHLGIRFDVLSWENSIRPAISTDGQAVINEQIGDKYDIFLGIMSHDFGSPTPRFSSGTEEEFNRALDRHNSNEEIEVMFYFRRGPIELDAIDPEQLKQVNQFREKVQNAGCLTEDYADSDSFYALLKSHLAKLAQQLPDGNTKERISHSRKSTELATAKNNFVEDDKQVVLVNVEESEFGMLDLLEIIETKGEMLKGNLISIIVANVSFIKNIQSFSEEIDQLDQSISSRERKLVVNKAADYINDFSQKIEAEIDKYKVNMKSITDAMANILIIVDDFEEYITGGKTGLRDAIYEKLSALNGATGSMSGMRDSVYKIPRMTKEVNQAKRDLLRVLDKIIRHNKEGARTIEKISELIFKEN